MASVNINIRTDSEIKKQAQIVFGNLGLDMSTAVNMFLRQTISKQTLPFPLAPIEPTVKRSPRFGIHKGKGWISDDFNEPIDDMFEVLK